MIVNLYSAKTIEYSITLYIKLQLEKNFCKANYNNNKNTSMLC